MVRSPRLVCQPTVDDNDSEAMMMMWYGVTSLLLLKGIELPCLLLLLHGHHAVSAKAIAF